MAESVDSHEERLSTLASQVHVLTSRVDHLSEQVAELAARPAAGNTRPVAAAITDSSSDDFAPPAELVAAWKRLTAPAFLSDFAILCLLLVVALILRTIVENGLINQLAGAVLGMSYAGLLIVYGGVHYMWKRPRAAMYTTSGLVLLLAIVFETHTLFQLIPPLAAYGILGAVLLPVTLLGVRYQATLPTYVALLGASVCGMAIEFPNPTFSVLGVLIAVANMCAIAHLGARASRTLSLLLFVVTMSFWLLWTSKAHTALAHELAEVAPVYLPWFLPLVCVFALTYACMAAWPIFQESGHLSLLERVVPALNVIWAYGAAETVGGSWPDRAAVIGLAGVSISAGHLGFAAWVARRGAKGSQASTSFTIAGVVLLALSLPACAPNMAWAVVVWSLVALYLCVVSEAQHLRPTLLASYVLQVFACVVAVVSGMLAAVAPSAGTRTVLLLLAAGFTLGHFHWPKRHGVPSAPTVFRAVSTLVLLAGMAYLFGASRIALYGAFGGEAPATFVGGQSLILNGLVVVMLLLGLRTQNGEFMVAALVVALGTAGKVFGYDLLSIHGIPRVLSVASSGVVAGAGSYVWRRWQQLR